MAMPSTTPREVTSQGNSPPACMAQLASRDSAARPCLAWTVVSEPPWPVLRAWRRSAARPRKPRRRRCSGAGAHGAPAPGWPHLLWPSCGPRTGRSSHARSKARACPQSRQCARPPARAELGVEQCGLARARATGDETRRGECVRDVPQAPGRASDSTGIRGAQTPMMTSGRESVGCAAHETMPFTA